MKALVTGSHGFVGRHLVDHLETSGDEVATADRSDGVDILDPSALHAALADARPQVVYHLAGFADVGASWDAPLDALRTNGEGVLNVLEAARKVGVERVLVVSSADVYGRVAGADLPLDEEQPLAPISPYGASKVAGEYVALQAWLGSGLETVRVRAFNHIGPGQSPSFIASAMAERIANAEREGADVVAVGNVTPRRDFTDVRDVVRAYRLAMLGGEPGEVYNVASGRAISIEQLCRALIDASDRALELAPDPALQRAVDNPVSVGDSTKLRRATGWEPTIPLEVTIRDLLDDARLRASTT